jgi:arylsulfatase
MEKSRVMMKKTSCCTACVAALFSAAQAATPADKPNVVFILMDDMGYADPGCYGQTRWTTPNIDSLARGGIRFTDFYSASPVSSPSRAALLTGRYSVRMGIQGVFFPESYAGMPPEEVTIAEILREEGYATSIVGKWHLGSRERFLPLQQGFDEYYGIPYSNDMSSQVLLRGNDVERFEIDTPNLTLDYTREAVSFIRRNASRPFFLYMAHAMMHVPIYVSQQFEGRSGAGLYGDAMMELDWSVGRVIDALREAGLLENTLVVLTSDNGPWLQEGPLGGEASPLREGKATSFEGGVRVPCIASMPGTITPGVESRVACMLDWMPTIAALSGAVLPAVTLDGCDISGVLLGNGHRENERYAYFHKNSEVTDLRVGDWKISTPREAIRGGFFRAGTDEHGYLLFNLREDPSERCNLWYKFPGKAAEMLRELESFRAGFGDVPPKLVTGGGNNSIEMLRLQRQQAQENARAAGFVGNRDVSTGFIDLPPGEGK